MNGVYYNEWDRYAAQWLRNLIAAGHLPAGDVDERSIVDVHPEDLRGYDQAHFFAGIGGWPLALQFAGWGDDPVWTGSCPCQPLSSAGQRKGHADERHLWPAFYRLIAECRPPVVFGEQVASKDGREWLAGVRADLEALGHACGAADLPACGVGAPHIRHRLWWVADAHGERERRGSGEEGSAEAQGQGEVGQQDGQRLRAVSGGDSHEDGLADTQRRGQPRQGKLGQSKHSEARQNRQADRAQHDCAGHWKASEYIVCADGKARRVEPSVPLLAHGLPARVGRLRAFGNAIVPQVGAEFVSAYMEAVGIVPSFTGEGT